MRAMTQASDTTTPSRRRVLQGALTGAAVLSVSALLEACGAGPAHQGAAAGSADPSANASAAASAAGSAADTGKEIPQLRVSLPGSLSNLYPGQEAGILNYIVAAVCMEGLVGVDADGKLTPTLASSVTQKGKSLVYTLRQGAVFHDGTPVTAADVLYSIEMARNSKSSPSVASYWADLASAEQTGPDEITLTSKSGAQSFAWLASNADALWIAPKAAWQRAGGVIGTAKALLVGTGPYRVTAFEPDSYVEFERNAHWWGTAPKAARIRFDFITDDDTRRLAWQSGQGDLSVNVPTTAAPQWEKLAGTRVAYEPDRSWVGLTFDTAKAPFDDPHVRRAIGYAINRQAIVDDLLRGHGQVATAMSTPEQFGAVWTPAEATRQLAAVPQYGYDLAKAKAELAASKVPQGFTATLSYPSSGPQLGTAALAFAADLKKIGITLNVKELAVEQWLSDLDSAPPLSYMWYFNTTGDPGELPSWLLAAGNPAKWTSHQVQAVLDSAGTEADPARRAALLVQAQAQAAPDAPYLPLWWGQSALALRDTVGLHDYTSYTFVSAWPAQVYAAR